jgi:hypothetical protein
MTANETDPATGTKSTRPEAPAEAASDTPTGNPSQGTVNLLGLSGGAGMVGPGRVGLRSGC